jgi:hypothetical protein
MFVRPCFLVVDREFAGSISSRKLVIETAKFNVITAYSYAEAKITIDRFPAIHAIVVSSDVRGQTEQFLQWAREKHSDIKVVVTGAVCVPDELADRQIDGFAPDKLLKALRDLFPEDSRAADDIERRLEEAAGER